MPFSLKVWEDAPSTDTPLSAAALVDMEERLSDYTDSASPAKTALPINVMDYGAAGDGITDDTAEIQAAMDACIGPGDPATVTRHAVRALYIPAGAYKITSTLLIRSVLGFRMFGDGFVSRLMNGAGVALTTLLDLDGVAHSDFRDFTIQAENETTATVDNAIHLRWSTAASRSTTQVAFHRVNIVNTKFKRGFAIENDDNSRQVDECLYEDCRVVGSWTAGEATWWQYGMRFGNGAAGNVLNHGILKGNLAGCAIGAAWVGSSGGVWAGGCQNNGVDFSGEGGPINRCVHVQDIRSEGADRLWVSGGPTAAQASVEFQDVDWFGNSMDADQRVIIHNHGGSLRMTNVGIWFANEDPLFEINCNVLDPVNAPNLVATFDGVSTRTAPGALFTGTFLGALVRVINYRQNDSNDSPVQSYAEYGAHPIPSIASATTVTLTPTALLTEFAEITGTTTITSVTAASPGQEVTLKFAGILTFTDGSNLKLAGNFVTSADDAIRLICDGTNWFEVCRSVN